MHSIQTIGPGRHVIRCDADEIGMVTFVHSVPREATLLRHICKHLDDADLAFREGRE